MSARGVRAPRAVAKCAMSTVVWRTTASIRSSVFILDHRLGARSSVGEGQKCPPSWSRTHAKSHDDCSRAEVPCSVMQPPNAVDAAMGHLGPPIAEWKVSTARIVAWVLFVLFLPGIFVPLGL